MAKIQLLVVKDKKTIDMTNLVQSVRWSGRKGSSARTITVTMIDDDGYRHARSGIDVADGNQCVFLVDGKERFRGILMNQNQGDKKQLKFKAYDNGIYLANNKDTFVYKNKTADQVFSDVCSRFGIPTGEVAKCSYKIPELTKSKTTGQDAVLDALGLDYKATGTRHFISSDKGKLSLLHSACQRDFEYAENGGFFNVLFACKDVDHIEHFAAHSCFPLKSSSAIKLARSTSLMPNVTCTGSALGLAALPDWRDLAA